MVLLMHAVTDSHVRDNLVVIELTLLLVGISLVEIVFVSREIHEHYIQSMFDRVLTIRLDDFILSKKQKNVKKIVEDFIQKYPMYKSKRNQIYHITCQIMETHKEEAWEDTLLDELKAFLKKTDETSVDGILEAFLNKKPSYKKHRAEVYRTIIQLMVDD